MKKLIVTFVLAGFVMTSSAAFAGESFFQGLADMFTGKGKKAECSSCKKCNCTPCKCAK
jgi:hypothetical protein